MKRKSSNFVKAVLCTVIMMLSVGGITPVGCVLT